VDDTVHEEDFQDVHDENNHVPQYPSFYGNVYDRTKRYLVSPPFRTRIIGDDINIMRGGGGNSSREMNRNNEDIHGSHS
jgi:rhamnose utilization protein RhaD (predicted bifunctional aldolase and dehydrogenase)